MFKFTLLCLLLCFNVYLLGANEFDDDLGGFTEETSEPYDDMAGFMDEDEVLDNVETVSEEQAYTLSGELAFKTSAGYKKHEVDGSEYSGINQAQTSLYLQLDSKLNDNWKLRISGDAFYDAIYDLRSDENYRQSVKDDYRTQLRLDDTYIQGSIHSDLDVKAGRQVVVWGKSDTIRITDIINPLDNRVLGMTDIEDLRLSVGMLKLDYYLSNWNVSMMVIPENRIMTEATPRGEYFPVDSVIALPGGVDDPFPNLEAPSTSWDNMQYAFAGNLRLDDGDISFYAAEVLDQRWHFNEIPRPGFALSERTVSKVKMLGTAFNLIEGSWLFKAELAYLRDLRYNTSLQKKKRLDALIGFEYMGFRDTTISFDLANRHIFEHEVQMSTSADMVDKNELQTALRFTRSFENETITANALITLFGDSFENGGFARIWGEYEIMDALSANLGIVEYIGGDKAYIEAIKDNDRVFADITYSF